MGTLPIMQDITKVQNKHDLYAPFGQFGNIYLIEDKEKKKVYIIHKKFFIFYYVFSLFILLIFPLLAFGEETIDVEIAVGSIVLAFYFHIFIFVVWLVGRKLFTTYKGVFHFSYVFSIIYLIIFSSLPIWSNVLIRHPGIASIFLTLRP